MCKKYLSICSCILLYNFVIYVFVRVFVVFVVFVINFMHLFVDKTHAVED